MKGRYFIPVMVTGILAACGGVSDDYDLCVDVEKARCERRAACQADPKYADSFKGFDLEKCVDYYHEICRTRDLADTIDQGDAADQLPKCLSAIKKYPCSRLYPVADTSIAETLQKSLLASCPFLIKEKKSDNGSSSNETDAGTSTESCDVFSQNCSDDAKACYPPAENASGTDGSCLSKGDKAMDDACGTSSECGKGYFCFKPEGSDSSACSKMCDVKDGDPGCPGGYDCVDSTVGSIGYCKKNA